MGRTVFKQKTHKETHWIGEWAPCVQILKGASENLANVHFIDNIGSGHTACAESSRWLCRRKGWWVFSCPHQHPRPISGSAHSAPASPAFPLAEHMQVQRLPKHAVSTCRQGTLSAALAQPHQPGPPSAAVSKDVKWNTVPHPVLSLPFP